MARELTIDGTIHRTGLFDPSSGEMLIAEKLVDITRDCSRREGRGRVFLLFTTAKRGRVVQIRRPFQGEPFEGTVECFFIDEIDPFVRSSANGKFKSKAREVGLTVDELSTLIKTHAPLPSETPA